MTVKDVSLSRGTARTIDRTGVAGNGGLLFERLLEGRLVIFLGWPTDETIRHSWRIDACNLGQTWYGVVPTSEARRIDTRIITPILPTSFSLIFDVKTENILFVLDGHIGPRTSLSMGRGAPETDMAVNSWHFFTLQNHNSPSPAWLNSIILLETYLCWRLSQYSRVGEHRESRETPSLEHCWTLHDIKITTSVLLNVGVVCAAKRFLFIH